jgi:hypothetical protein
MAMIGRNFLNYVGFWHNEFSAYKNTSELLKESITVKV